jgi:hypothetical protein
MGTSTYRTYRYQVAGRTWQVAYSAPVLMGRYRFRTTANSLDYCRIINNVQYTMLESPSPHVASSKNRAINHINYLIYYKVDGQHY